MSKNPIICAIDTHDIDKANALINSVKPSIGAVKLGLEFFISQGRQGVRKIAENDVDIFLDLKLHDIPNTVNKAVKEVAKLNCWMTTIHTLGGTDVMKAARTAVEESEKKPLLIGVTILTSHIDIAEVGIDYGIRDEVLRLTELAIKSGLDGIVCSPHEIAEIRKNFGKELKLVVPGIRSATDKKDDQARIMSASEALKLGADYLVIGRPITAAENPPLAAESILKSVA